MDSPQVGAGLLATDLDRTLLPNGAFPETPHARTRLAAFVRERGLRLAYVTGRSLPLVEEAIEEYELPAPDWILADVGSTLYRRDDGAWQEEEAWAARLARDWPARNGPVLAPLFADLPALRLQPAAAQRPFKLSFFASRDVEVEALRREMAARLHEAGLPSVIVHSVDEAEDIGLVDVLPAGSSKRGALEFLVARCGLPLARVLFAGDSGNDRDVLVSPIPAVLVANADEALRARLRRETAELGTTGMLYLAHGDDRGNGNYAAGILEGWLHYHPGDRELRSVVATSFPSS